MKQIIPAVNNRRRNSTLSIRVSEDEKKTIKAQARRNRLCITDYLILMLLADVHGQETLMRLQTREVDYESNR